jgi:alkylhydroperoxidase family enzyme
VAEQAGLSQDEIGRVQQFESEDEKRAAALRFAREVVESRGHASDEAFNEAREAGYTDEQIMEIIATIALATFTNYMNDVIGTEVDLPVVEPVQSS